MKKIIFIIVCLFSLIIVKAESLNFEYLPYYVLIKKNGIENFIQIKKIYNNNNEVVFNMDPDYYLIKNDYIKNSEVNLKNYGKHYKEIELFNTIVYYTYNRNVSDLNYYFTQLFIWNIIGGYSVTMVNEDGELINDYISIYNTYWNDIFNHDVNPNFHNKEYNVDLWDNLKLTYFGVNKILDNPVIDGLKFYNDKRDLFVYVEENGKYKIDLAKKYQRENYSYNNGNSFYWQNLGGPSDIYKCFYVNVNSIELKIKENIIGVNKKIGDAKITDINYELFFNDKLQLIINDLANNFIKPNSNYYIKDVSNNIGFKNANEINFNVLNDEYELLVDKYVISKNISVNILDNYTYYVYLKSNNELYEIINSKTDLITLPYGVYYIICDEIDYYQEIEIYDNNDDLLNINNLFKENNDIENNLNSDVDENTITNGKENIFIPENPKTLDNINLYFILAFLSCILTFILGHLVEKESN